MSKVLLVFTNDELLELFTDSHKMLTVTDLLMEKGEVFHIYQSTSNRWYRQYNYIAEENVPPVYRALKLMLTN